VTVSPRPLSLQFARTAPHRASALDVVCCIRYCLQRHPAGAVAAARSKCRRGKAWNCKKVLVDPGGDPETWLRLPFRRTIYSRVYRPLWDFLRR